MPSPVTSSHQSTEAYHHDLQLHDPIHWNPEGHWVLTRHRDVQAVLRDARFGHPTLASAQGSPAKQNWAERMGKWLGRNNVQQIEANPDLFVLIKAKWIAYNNPPEHTRMRALVNQAVTFQRINALRPRMETIANHLIDEVIARGSMDVVADLAYPLATMTIAELLGVPPADYSSFVEHLSHGQDVFTQLATNEPNAVREIHAHAFALIAFFRALIAQRRAKPENDLISALIAAGDNRDQLNDDELLSNVILLAIAGHETTFQFLSLALWHLLRQPSEWTKLRTDTELSGTVVQELLRLACPVQITARVALEDVMLGGKTIRKGEMVRLALATANRDAAEFDHPEQLDLTRRRNPHLTFGSGIHQCVGAPLARLETTVALGVMLQRLPNLQLKTEPVNWRDDIFHSPKSLWVTF